MKRLAMAFAAFLALCTTVQTVNADWFVEIGSDGWLNLIWDPNITGGNGTIQPPPPPPPPPPPSLFWFDGHLCMIVGGQLYYFNGSGWVPYNG